MVPETHTMLVISPEAAVGIVTVIFSVFGGGWVWVNKNISNLRRELQASMEKKVDRDVCDALHETTQKDVKALACKFWRHNHDDQGNVIIPRG